MKAVFFGCALTFSITASSFDAYSYPEKYYQAKWCASHYGQAEVVLEDQTRADCITTTHAIEFWFAAANNEGV